jgi:hypothetical protein
VNCKTVIEYPLKMSANVGKTSPEGHWQKNLRNIPRPGSIQSCSCTRQTQRLWGNCCRIVLVIERIKIRIGDYCSIYCHPRRFDAYGKGYSRCIHVSISLAVLRTREVNLHDFQVDVIVIHTRGPIQWTKITGRVGDLN